MRIINGAKGDHCLYPFQIDPYYNGCKHGCLYCYAASLANSFGLSFDTFTTTDVALLRKRLNRPSGKMGEFIKRKHPLRIGGMSDPFMNGINHSITRNVIEVLNEFEYPHLIFTKSDNIVNAMDILNPDLCQIQISVSTKYDSILEPNASSNLQRFEACRELSDNEFQVIGRLAPIIPLWADGYEDFENFENVKCDSFSFAFAGQFHEYGASGLITEMMRLTPWMLNNLRKAGINIDSTISEKSIRKNGTIYYSSETRKRYYDELDYTRLPLTYCDTELWNTAQQGDCCQWISKTQSLK